MSSTSTLFILVLVALGFVGVSLYAVWLGLRLRATQKTLQNLVAAQTNQAPPKPGRGFAFVMLVFLFLLWVAVMRAGV